MPGSTSATERTRSESFGMHESRTSRLAGSTKRRSMAVAAIVLGGLAAAGVGFLIRPRREASPLQSVDAGRVRLRDDLPLLLRAHLDPDGDGWVPRMDTHAIWSRPYMRRGPLPPVPLRTGRYRRGPGDRALGRRPRRSDCSVCGGAPRRFSALRYKRVGGRKVWWHVDYSEWFLEDGIAVPGEWMSPGRTNAGLGCRSNRRDSPSTSKPSPGYARWAK